MTNTAKKDATADPALSSSFIETAPAPKVCPECQHVFQGNGWDGIDAHWKARHGAVMPYKEAWPLVRTGTYTGAKP